MDIQRQAFERVFKEKLGAHGCQFDLDQDGNYEDRETLCAWLMWQQAQKVVVPEGFVLLSHEDIARLMNTIDFLGVKALGDEYISFSEIHKIVEEWQEQNKAVIEAQEPTHD